MRLRDDVPGKGGLRVDAFTGPLRTQIPRHNNNGDSLSSISQECSLQPRCALIVKEVLIPMFFHQFGNDYSDLALWIPPLKIQNVVDNR